MLRLHFTATDLLHTKFATRPAPLIELGLAIAVAQHRDPAVSCGPRELADRMPTEARLLFELIPASATGPMFLDPVSDTIDDGVDMVLASSRRWVIDEMCRTVSGDRRPSRWLRALATHDMDAWRVLGDALRAAHDAVLDPIWPAICARYRHEVSVRARLIAQIGLNEALCGVYPGTSWQGDTLVVNTHTELDVFPGGAGVTLMPSMLWTGRPLVTFYPDGSTLVIFCASAPLRLESRDVAAADSLRELLGATRAEVLAAITTGRSTTELARELDISAATASEHAKILRATGLTSTRRDGRSAIHELTPLGHQLLTASANGADFHDSQLGAPKATASQRGRTGLARVQQVNGRRTVYSPD